MKKVWLIIIAVAVIIAGGLLCSVDQKGETCVKQGILINVVLSGESSMVLTFNDGEIITVEESNNEDALEMIFYLDGWVSTGEEMILEYTYHSDIDGYEIDSVSGINN